MEDFTKLLSKANKVYRDNFSSDVMFERAIFFSWYCGIGDCKYCYMSTQTNKIKDPEKARRSAASLIAEAIICKELNWEVSFLAGGYRAYELKGFYDLAKNISEANGSKLWLNIGALTKKELDKFKDVSKGVCAAIEIINPKLRKKVCPSKPIDEMIDMLEHADKLGYKKVITIILGLGETLDDFKLLSDFIKKHKVDKVCFYSLNPHKGTVYEGKPSPSGVSQATWVAKTRIKFPKINISAGIWSYKVSSLGLQLLAGANSFTKFPAIKLFNSKETRIIEEEVKSSGRVLKSRLTGSVGVDIAKNVDELNISEDLKKSVKEKLNRYINRMNSTTYK